MRPPQKCWGKTDSKDDVSGDFCFTYDQDDISSSGEYTITVQDNWGPQVDCTVTKNFIQTPDATETLSAYFLAEGVGLRLYNHTARETYYPHIYSISYSGKTVRTDESTAPMDFGQDEGNIVVWTEKHRYAWDGGTTSWVSMVLSGGLVPPGVVVKKCQTITWCIPDQLEGIAKCTALAYDYGGGTVPATPILNPEVDRSMPEE